MREAGSLLRDRWRNLNVINQQPTRARRVDTVPPLTADGNDVKARQTYLEMAQECLFEAGRTLDPEASATLRKLAERFFKEAERHNEIRPGREVDVATAHVSPSHRLG
jgi:hypothetical protein